MPFNKVAWLLTLQSSLKIHWWRYRHTIWWYFEVNRLFKKPHVTVLCCFCSQQDHTNALSELRFTLAFVHCVIELASSKELGLTAISSPDVSFLEQSLVTDQISLLNKEWRWDRWSFLHFLNMTSSSLPSQIFSWMTYVSYLHIPAMQSSWCCTWRLQSFCHQRCTMPKRTSNKANFVPLLQSNKVRWWTLV